VRAQELTFAVGSSLRSELRFGDRSTGPWTRVGGAGEVTLGLYPTRAPFGLEVRMQQWLLGGIHDTCVLFDLAVGAL
jgi:hypothetical protein